jgi:Protein of unknown function (DUF3500)
MKLLRLLLALPVLGLVASLAYVAQSNESAGAKMTGAADKFLASLTGDQKGKAVIDFDDKERFNWHFTPYQDNGKKPKHRGLPLEEMNKEQKEAALGLLRAGTSGTGYERATTIMSLENILLDLEKGSGPTRNPGNYFFSIFGTPSKTAAWGWRVEGHHLSLNFTLDKGKVVSATPAFFGANPAVFIGGARKGQEVLPEAEDYAKDLFKSLDDDQKKVAIQKEPFPEIEEAAKTPTKVGEAKGLSAAKMTEKQRDLLQKLLQGYADRMPPDIAKVEMARVKDGGLDKVSFAYQGGLAQGEKHSYRIQGPSFVVEFLNIQDDSAKNPADHIHSAWRSLKDDFGVAAK